MKNDVYSQSIKLHKKLKGKLEIISKVPLKTKKDLSLLYTPGVAQPSKDIAKDKDKAYMYTGRGNLVAVVSDGSAVLGLGNIGPEGAMPVMSSLPAGTYVSQSELAATSTPDVSGYLANYLQTLWDARINTG